MRQKLLLLAALGFGVLAFILTFMQIKKERDRILGATRKVYLVRMKEGKLQGEIIQDDDIEPFEATRFKGQVTQEISWAESDKLIGRKIAFEINKGEILQWINIGRERVGMREGLSGALKTGQRAISISVDATSAVTHLIQPGNHVDIIGTFRFPDMRGDKALDTITLTILQNVLVLATGTETTHSSPRADFESRRRRSYSTISLALTPKEVEMIIFATQKGRLHMSLRPYQETRIDKDLQSVNFKYLEENIKKYNEEREKRMMKY